MFTLIDETCMVLMLIRRVLTRVYENESVDFYIFINMFKQCCLMLTMPAIYKPLFINENAYGVTVVFYL